MIIDFFLSQIVSGPENCVLLVTCATREKEGSNEDPLVDEMAEQVEDCWLQQLPPMVPTSSSAC